MNFPLVFTSIFWNEEERRIRALWRLTLQALVMIGLVLLGIFLIAEPLTSLHKRGLFLPSAGPESYDHIINMIIGPVLTILVIGSVWLAARWFDHRRLSDYGLRITRTWRRDFLFGLALGAVLMSGVFLWECHVGWITIVGSLRTKTAGFSLSLGIFFILTKDLCVGIYEEIVSRGYLLTNLVDGFEGVSGLGYRGAVAISILLSSTLFGALHAFNENSTLYSTVNLAFIGIMFAVAYVATGELGLPIGLHISWNLFQGLVFGLAVSGDKEVASMLAIKQSGPLAFTGGAFGPEAGLTGTAAATLGIVLILAWALLQKRSPLSVRARAVTAS